MLPHVANGEANSGTQRQSLGKQNHCLCKAAHQKHITPVLCQRCWSTEPWQPAPGQAASEVLPQGPQNANGQGQHGPLACPGCSWGNPCVSLSPSVHLTWGSDASCRHQIRSHPPDLQTSEITLESAHSSQEILRR